MSTATTTPVPGASGANPSEDGVLPVPPGLLGNGAFRKLFAGSFFGTLGDRLYLMAIIVAVQAAFVEATKQLTLITLVGVGAQFLLFPAVGYFVDCLDRRKLLRGIVLIKVVLVLAVMPLLADPTDPGFQDSWAWTLCVIFALSVVSTTFSPARASAIPDVAEPAQYGLAASLLATTGLLSILVGSTLGAFLAARWLSPMTTVLVASVVYLAATLCLWWLPDQVAVPGKDRKREGDAPPDEAALPTTGGGTFSQRMHAYLRETRQGLSYCFKRRGIPALILFESCFWVCAVSFYLLLEWHAANRLLLIAGQKSEHLGLSMGAAGLGLFIGAFLIGKLCRHLSPLFSYPLSFVLVGVAMKWVMDAQFDLLLGTTPVEQARALLPAMFLVGLGGGTLLGRIDADLLAVTDAEVRGRVFSVKGFFFSGALLVPLLMFWTDDPVLKENFAFFMPTALMLAAIPVVVLAWILDVGIYTSRPNAVKAEAQELVSFFTARFFAWLFFKVYFRIEVEGEEHIPKTGPVLLAANHGSFLDPLWMGCGLSRRVQYIMHSSYYYSTWGHPFFRLMNTIPVDQSSNIRALKQGSEALKQGVVLGMFPEGHVSDDGALQKPKAGVLFLAQRSGAPVVPVAIVGNTQAFARWHKIPRPTKIKLVVMEPIAIPRKADRKEVADITDRIMVQIAEKLNLPAPPSCAEDVPDRNARRKARNSSSDENGETA